MAGHIASSKSNDWVTPQDIVDLVRSFYADLGHLPPAESIDLDPCSNPKSLVNARTNFLLPQNDGLKEDWVNFENIYVNPPYGRGELLPWCEKMYQSATYSNILALLPAKVGTRAFQYIFNSADAICFIKSRVTFDGAEQGAPMDCCFVFWSKACVDDAEYHHRMKLFHQYFSSKGNIVWLQYGPEGVSLGNLSVYGLQNE